MKQNEILETIRNELDKSSLLEVMLAMMDGWARVCPHDELHVMSLPRKSERAEQWLFEQVRNVIVEYREMQ